MAYGLLGKQVTVANSWIEVYKAPANISYSLADILVCNREATDVVTVEIAISFTDVPDNTDYVEPAAKIEAKGGLTREFLKLSPGERVMVRASSSLVTVRVQGLEENISSQTNG